MEDISTASETVIELDKPAKTFSNKAIFLTLLIFLLVTVSLAFLTGFFVGKAESNKLVVSNTSKATIKKSADKVTFQDPKENYTLIYPATWQGTEKVSNAPGVLIESKEGSVELWLRVEQPFSLASEQKEALATTNKVKIKVNNKELEITEYVYKTGGFFSVVVFPATTKTPLVTFWLKASDAESYKVAKEIVQSFKFE